MVALAPKLFATPTHAGELRIDDEELANNLSLVAPGDPSPADDVVVRKALGGNNASLKKYLATVKEPYLIEAVCTMAKEMDLPTSKMKLIKEAFPNKFLDD